MMTMLIGPSDSYGRLVSYLFVILVVGPTCCLAQIQAGVFDFGLARQGEKRGSWTPGEWLAVVLLIMIIVLGFGVSLGLCYYVARRQSQRTFGFKAPASGREARQRNRLGEFVLIRPGDASSAGSNKQYVQGGGSLVAEI